MLNRGGERMVMPGDAILLADAEALPWHKVQALLPLDGGYDTDNVTYKDGIALIIFGYIFALMGGLLGMIFGSILAFSTQQTPRGKVKKYKPSSVTNGLVIFWMAVFFMAFWLTLRLAI
jgi:hypothetical protein